MKKNTMMRLASALLVCVLLSTCVIGGTFAKYTSSATNQDKARVAYWGWGFDGEIEFDLFNTSYDANNVLSSNGDNLVAPGTKQETTFTFAYKPTANGNALNAGAIAAPEVAYDFTVSFVVNATDADIKALDDNLNFVWKLNGKEYQTVAQLTEAVMTLSGEADGTTRYAAGKLPAAFAAADNDAVENTIGWEWKFETKDNTAQDEQDTAMGNATDLADVTFTITITATQVD